MPIRQTVVNDMQAVNTGDMGEIPPDLPEGTWVGTFEVKQSKTSKDKFPMLILTITAEEAETDGNEEFVGRQVSDFLTFFPENHKASKMGKARAKEITDAYELPTLDASSLAENDWTSVVPWVEALEEGKKRFYTTVETDNRNPALKRTKIYYLAPGGGGEKTQAAAELDDNEEKPKSKDKPRVGPNGRPLKPKTK